VELITFSFPFTFPFLDGEGARGVVGDSGDLLGDSGGVRFVSIRTVGRIVDFRTRLVGEEVALLVSDKSSTSTSSSE
jgi:hypothetical protein